jgi:hypothetical protein
VNELGEIMSYEREGHTVLGSSGDFEVEHAGTGVYVVHWTKLGTTKREPKPTPHQVIHLALAGSTATSIRLVPFVNEEEGFTVETLGGLKEGVFVANQLSNCGWHLHVMSAVIGLLPEPPA